MAIDALGRGSEAADIANKVRGEVGRPAPPLLPIYGTDDRRTLTVAILHLCDAFQSFPTEFCCTECAGVVVLIR